MRNENRSVCHEALPPCSAHNHWLVFLHFRAVLCTCFKFVLAIRQNLIFGGPLYNIEMIPKMTISKQNDILLLSFLGMGFRNYNVGFPMIDMSIKFHAVTKNLTSGAELRGKKNHEFAIEQMLLPKMAEILCGFFGCCFLRLFGGCTHDRHVDQN